MIRDCVLICHHFCSESAQPQFQPRVFEYNAPGPKQPKVFDYSHSQTSGSKPPSDWDLNPNDYAKRGPAQRKIFDYSTGTSTSAAKSAWDEDFSWSRPPRRDDRDEYRSPKRDWPRGSQSYSKEKQEFLDRSGKRVDSRVLTFILTL